MNKLLHPLAVGAVLSCLLALGCGDDSGEMSKSSSAGAGGESALPDALEIQGDRRIPFTPTTDLEFADFFIMHHEMAISMANAETSRGSDSAVVELAKNVVSTQTAEVGTFIGLRAQLSSEGPAMLSDPHVEAEMQAIAMASGAELDRLFLQEMIAHHAAALAPAWRATGYLKAAELKQMVPQMLQAQAEEIGAMRAMLERLGVTGAGEDLAPDSLDRPDFGLVGDRRVPLTPEDDVQFIDFLVPHHQRAIEMADEEIARGSAADVVKMATAMKQTQSDEVQLMASKRIELTSDAEAAPVPADPLATSDMDQMKSLSGAGLDQLFLQLMVVHHGAALPLSHRAKPHVADAELGKLADDVFQARASEIGDMQKLLTP